MEPAGPPRDHPFYNLGEGICRLCRVLIPVNTPRQQRDQRQRHAQADLAALPLAGGGCFSPCPLSAKVELNSVGMLTRPSDFIIGGQFDQLRRGSMADCDHAP